MNMLWIAIVYNDSLGLNHILGHLARASSQIPVHHHRHQRRLAVFEVCLWTSQRIQLQGQVSQVRVVRFLAGIYSDLQ